MRELAPAPSQLATRVIADHLRAAVALLAEDVLPGNVDQPYVARRLIRRASRYGREIGIRAPFMARVAETVIGTLADAYPAFALRQGAICAALDDEEARFGRTLARGEAEFERLVATSRASGEQMIGGPAAFRLYDTYGFPRELTEELAERAGLAVDGAGFEAAFAAHQAQSRQGAAERFRGGLAERVPETARLHTATHLLHSALRQVLGPHVEQRGSNITAERLRFDFAHPERLTDAQVAQVEQLVNEQIARDLPVTWQELELAEARRLGAIGLFGERYGERVKVYSIGEFSREICGGPHAERTGALGRFRIAKEQAVAAGVRRIRAVLE